MSKLTKMITTLFSFFFAFFLFLDTFTVISKLTIMNESYILYNLEKADFYQGMADEINTYLKYTAGGAGYDPAIYDNYVREEEVKQTVENSVAKAFAKENVEVDSTTFKQNLKQYLLNMANEDATITPDEDARLNEYVNQNATTYEKYLSLSFLPILVMGIEMMNQVLPFIIGMSFLIVMFSFSFMIRMKSEWRADSHYIYNGCISAGIMTLIPSVFILVGQFIRKINITPQCYYKFLVNYLERFFWYGLIAGLCFVLISLIVILWQNTRNGTLIMEKLKRKRV